ncbi:MAG: thioredoxin domain-containing protein [Prevotella sp.]|jgi:hypothetical protein|nr:thioredoxin domain-containing protein [Prevotella sp.]
MNNKSTHNVFITFLEELQVKHTSFSSKYFQEHPHKHSLYGLSKMLSEYHIENKSIRVKNKEEMLPELESPFIAHIGNDFVTVTAIQSKMVEYVWKNKRISILMEEFIKIWSGIVLLAESDNKSIEPDYEKHHKEEFAAKVKMILLLLTVVLLLGIVGFSTKIYSHAEWLSALFLNSIGAYIGYLLLLKQMQIHSNYANIICSLLIRQSDCNSVLESNSASFLSLFSWSEIGTGYFVSNILILLFSPALYPFAAFINICALPYTIWSVWYQKTVAKQWCPLCLIVQALLWLLFVNNMIFGLIQCPAFSISIILFIGCIYIVPILILNLLIPNLSNKNKIEEITQEINSLNADEEIFQILLRKKNRYEVNKETSQLLWGNPEAKNLVTIVTNPHCNPCEKTHIQMEQLLRNTKDGYCVQYILTSFNEELEESCKLFIAMYRQNDIPNFLLFLKDWYKNGKNNRKEFYRKYPFSEKDEEILFEYQKHKEWLANANIRATPIILFNGYELSEKYKVEYLKYFTELYL